MKKFIKIPFLKKAPEQKSEIKDKECKEKEKVPRPLSGTLCQLMLNTGQIAGASVLGQENRDILQNKFSMIRKERKQHRLNALRGNL